MAFSPTDPVLAHSLWLQLRSCNRRSRLGRWRSDWMPLLVPILLLSILAMGYVIMFSNGTGGTVEQSAQREAVLQDQPVVGAIAGP